VVLLEENFDLEPPVLEHLYYILPIKPIGPSLLLMLILSSAAAAVTTKKSSSKSRNPLHQQQATRTCKAHVLGSSLLSDSSRAI
jgi:hypothetical protein